MTKRFSCILLLFAALGAQAQSPCDEMQRIGAFQHQEIGAIPLREEVRNEKKWLGFASQMAVNTDGAPDSYHPDNLGITHLCNGISVGSRCQWKADCMADYRKAKAEGFRGPTKICFFAMVADANGVPVIQKEGDPKPGFFVSTTTLQQPGVPPRTPQAQMDSNEIPFVVIPRHWQSEGFRGVKLGDFAAVYRKSTNQLSFAIVGDLGPKNKLGEGSVALHQALGNDPFQMRFGKRRAFKGIKARDVVYFVFPGSRKPGEKITKELIDQEGRRRLDEMGGEERLRACAGGI